MEFKTVDDYKYGMIDTYLKSSMDNRYVAGIMIPMNNWNARDELAMSILLTVFKVTNGHIYTEYHPFDSFEVGRHDEMFNTIDTCQTLFKSYIKHLKNGIYSVGHVRIVVGIINFFNQHNFVPTDLDFTEDLIKAAIIVKGMLQYTTSGKFTDECLALVDDYRAAKMLEG